jgi:hypothetical protein
MVDRYTYDVDSMSRFPDGDWVSVEDYEELSLKHRRLRDSVERIVARLVEGRNTCYVSADGLLRLTVRAIDDSLVISDEALKSEED